MRFRFPNPLDRTMNNPSILLNSDRVIKLLNEVRGEHTNYIGGIPQDAKDWLINYAKEEGWDEVRIAGKQLLLSKHFIPNPKYQS